MQTMRCTARSGSPACYAASANTRRQQIADAILADVSSFLGEQDRFDDETIIVLKVR